MNRPFFERHNADLRGILRTLAMINDDRCGIRPQSTEPEAAPMSIADMMTDSESLIGAIEREVQFLLESSCLKPEAETLSGATYANPR